jgi:hypothetical protein
MARKLTVNQAVSRASMEVGIALAIIPQVVNSADQDVVQMRELLHALAGELLLDEPYKVSLGDGCWLTHNGVPTDEIQADADLIQFDGRLTIDGLKWRFLKAKGLEFGEEMRDFTVRLNKLSKLANGTVIDLYEDEGRTI